MPRTPPEARDPAMSFLPTMFINWLDCQSKHSLLYCYSTGHSYTDVEVDAIMNLGDIDGDGEIDLQVSKTTTLQEHFY
jgi:hypothetical protein